MSSAEWYSDSEASSASTTATAFDKRYLKLDNCFLLPHIGSSNYETRDAMAMLAVKNINAFFDNKTLLSRVTE